MNGEIETLMGVYVATETQQLFENKASGVGGCDKGEWNEPPAKPGTWSKQPH